MFIGPDGVAQRLVKNILSEDKRLEISDTFDDATQSVTTFRNKLIDAVICDLSSLHTVLNVSIRRLVKIDPNVKIIVVSPTSGDFTRQANAAILSGATAHIVLPTEGGEGVSSEFKNKFIKTVYDLAKTREKEGDRLQLNVVQKITQTPTSLKLVDASKAKPTILAIGSSTGGPNALQTVFEGLPASFTAPILITQHMPPTFTPVLAATLSKKTGRQITEGQDGDPVINGRVYVAPGDYHMTVEKSPVGPVIRTNQGPLEYSCRPSVDPMLRSIAALYGDKSLAVILTGMGADGSKGSVHIADAGSTVIVQDFETSVVWGMPGAAAMLGCCAAVLPITEIAPYIVGKFK